MSRSGMSESRQFMISRYLFWVTFVVAAVVSIALGGADDPGTWPAVLAVGCMALYLVVSKLWTPVVLKHEDYADSFYFLGFLLTLVALVATLMGLSGVADEHIQNLVLGRFGLALATTIFGLATRTALRMFQEKEEDSLLDTVARSQEALRKSADELRMVLQNASTDMETTLGSASSRIDIAVGELTGRLATLRDEITHAGGHLAPWTEALEHAEMRTKAWSEGMKAAQSNTVAWSAQSSKLTTDLEGLDEAAATSTRNLSALAAAASSAVTRASELQATSASIQSSLEGLRKAFHGMGELPDISPAIGRMATAVGQGDDALRQLSQSASSATTALDRVRTASDEVTLDGLKALSTVAANEAATLDAVLAQWRGALSELTRITNELGQRKAIASEALLSVRDELTTGVQFLTRLAQGDQA